MQIRYFLSFIFILFLPFVNLYANTKGEMIRLKRVQMEGVENAYTPKVLGLFIGISGFEDPVWHDLNYPEKDVQDMVNFFSENWTMALDDKMVLTGSEKTTRDHVLNYALRTFGLKNASEEDVVIVYISGHGTLTRDFAITTTLGMTVKEPCKRPFIVASDTQSDRVAETAIPLHQITQWFENIKSRRKALILDMCHSGLGKSQISPYQEELIYSAKGINFEPIEDSWASIILSACPMGGTSYEDANLENSVYTHFLLEGMQKGDLNHDGAVSISEAHNYAIDRTALFTEEKKGHRQIPTAYSRVLGKDPIVVCGSPTGTGNPTLFSYSSTSRNVEVYVDQEYKGMFPKGVAIETGKHLVELKKQNKIVFKKTIDFDDNYDYMFSVKTTPPLKVNTFIQSEGGYRSYSGQDIPDDLTPSGITGGFSIHATGIKASWLGGTYGMEYSRNQDVRQYAVRAGINFRKTITWADLMAGPELMFLFIEYFSDQIDRYYVDRNMFFTCPGVQFMISKKTRHKMVLSFGARAHYMPYELDTVRARVIAGQGFAAVGYDF